MKKLSKYKKDSRNIFPMVVYATRTSNDLLKISEPNEIDIDPIPKNIYIIALTSIQILTILIGIITLIFVKKQSRKKKIIILVCAIVFIVVTIVKELFRWFNTDFLAI